MSHTIYYEASEKLESEWIEENSVAHTFANGKELLYVFFV